MLGRFTRRNRNLQLAFRALMVGDIPGVPHESKSQGLPFEAIRLLVMELNQLDNDLPFVPPEHVRYLFSTLDDNENGCAQRVAA